MDRRFFVASLALGPATLAAPARAPARERIRFAGDPFTLGVASGYPSSDSVVLWTRLAPEPLAPDGGMPAQTVPVSWEVAADERFRKIVRRGTAWAEPEWAHSVHVEPHALEPGRPWWYRFRVGDATSPVGRTWTAPAAGAAPERLRLAVASCQHYEHGYYSAYRHMIENDTDLIVHVGDYIYENSWGDDRIRFHEGPECYTLADYRRRHAQYRLEPELAAAHGACPWLLSWDDHEVDNDYAGELSEWNDVRESFLQRRAAAYRAFYEHMPLPRHSVPQGPWLRLHTTRSLGDLATFYLLDGRQHRSAHPCPPPGRAGSRRLDVTQCPGFGAEDGTMLGAAQESWLGARLAASRTRWNLLAQGVVFNHHNEAARPERLYWTDSWSGYPAARARLLSQLRTPSVSNPVFFSGDIHAFVAGDVHSVADDPATPLISSELVTTSITSQATPAAVIERIRSHNPHVRLIDQTHRGFLRVDLGRDALRADLIAMDTVLRRDSTARTIASFTIEAGRAGLQRA